MTSDLSEATVPDLCAALKARCVGLFVVMVADPESASRGAYGHVTIQVNDDAVLDLMARVHEAVEQMGDHVRKAQEGSP